jgi:prophage regulatory protein
MLVSSVRRYSFLLLPNLRLPLFFFMKSISHKFLRLPEVKSITGLSKSSIYARIADGNFPKQISLGSRLVVWIEADIQNWIGLQIQASTNS